MNDGGDPYSGGSLTRAGRPTGASGDFNSPGVAGFPVPSAGQIAIARNNQGTNVRIPYSRVCPMHGKDKLRVRDSRLAGSGTSEVYEYDGLEAGELAWVMGKQFAINPGNTSFPSLVATAVEHAVLLHNVDAAADAINRISASWRSQPAGGFLQGEGGAMVARYNPPAGDPAHVAAYPEGTPLDVNNREVANARYVGPDGAALVPQDTFGGFGPDRMQRMAYTNWVEAWFEQRIATQRIDLAATPIVDAAGTHAFLDADIAYFGELGPLPTAPGRGHNQPRLPPGPRPGGEARYLAGATVLCAPDLAYALQATAGMRHPGGTTGTEPINSDLLQRGYQDPDRMQVQVPMMQGLFLMEQGPFLRTYGSDHFGVDIRLPGRHREWAGGAYGAGLAQTPKLATVDRHLGSSLAQKALYATLKKHGVFNWTPDGVCLSKFSTGPDGYTDDEFDARSGQLLNIGVQGPCITKTWAMGDSEMHAMPGDKLFVLVMGTVNYEVGERGEAGGDSGRQGALNDLIASNAQITRGVAREGFAETRAYEGADKARPNAARYESRPDEVERAEQARRALYAANGPCDQARDGLAAWLAGAEGAGETQQSGEFRKLVAAMNALRAVADPSTTGQFEWEAYRTQAQAQLEVVQNGFSGVARANVAMGSRTEFAETDDGAGNTSQSATARTPNAFSAVAADVRAGRRGMLKAELTDIRLKRATSSYLTNRSHFDPGDPKSRCGLKIGYNQDDVAPSNGGAGTRNPGRDKLVAAGGVDPGDGVTGNYYRSQAEVETGRAAGHATARINMRSDPDNGRYTSSMPMADIPKPQTFTDRGSLARKARTGTAEYILGAWCIGTVTDSAASRAVMHANQVRTAPSSMAVNVNVNVEWWDGDCLYQHYMDKDRGHYKEDVHPAVSLARKGGKVIEAVDQGGDGHNFAGTRLVQVAQGTTMQRTQQSNRTVESYVREVVEGHEQTMNRQVGIAGVPTTQVANTGYGTTEEDARVNSPSDPSDTLRGLAIRRLSDGKGEYEGTVVQPDPRGVDDDPEGLRIYDLRQIKDADRGNAGYVNAAGVDVALVETRHWSAARPA